MVISKSTEDVGMLYRLERRRSQHTLGRGRIFYDEQIEGSYSSNASSSKEGEECIKDLSKTKAPAVWMAPVADDMAGLVQTGEGKCLLFNWGVGEGSLWEDTAKWN